MRSAPAAITARTSSPSRAKSADRMLGAMRRAVAPRPDRRGLSRIVIRPFTIVRLLRVIGPLGPLSDHRDHENVRGGYGHQLLAPQRLTARYARRCARTESARCDTRLTVHIMTLCYWRLARHCGVADGSRDRRRRHPAASRRTTLRAPFS